MKTILTILSLLICYSVFANKYTVTSTNQATTNISSTKNIHEGDTVYFDATVNGFNGSGLYSTDPTRPIHLIFANWNQKINGGRANYGFKLINFANVVLEVPDGDTLEIDGLSTGAGMVLEHGDTSFFGARGTGAIYIHDVAGPGLQFKTNFDATNSTTLQASAWNLTTQTGYASRNLKFRNFIIKRTGSEGVYGGHTGSPLPPSGWWVAPNINDTLYNFIIDSTGWDGFQLSNMWGFYVKNLQIYQPAYKKASSQSTGMPVQDDCSGTIDSFYIKAPFVTAIMVLGRDTVKLMNGIIDSVDINQKIFYVDNRASHYNKDSLYMWLYNVSGNMKVNTNNTANPMQIVNNNNGGRTTRKGLVQNFYYYNYNGKKILDNVGFTYCGGTEGTVGCDTPAPDSFYYRIDLYEGIYKDSVKLRYQPSSLIKNINSMDVSNLLVTSKNLFDPATAIPDSALQAWTGGGNVYNLSLNKYYEYYIQTS